MKSPSHVNKAFTGDSALFKTTSHYSMSSIPLWIASVALPTVSVFSAFLTSLVSDCVPTMHINALSKQQDFPRSYNMRKWLWLMLHFNPDQNKSHYLIYLTSKCLFHLKSHKQCVSFPSDHFYSCWCDHCSWPIRKCHVWFIILLFHSFILLSLFHLTDFILCFFSLHLSIFAAMRLLGCC